QPALHRVASNLAVDRMPGPSPVQRLAARPDHHRVTAEQPQTRVLPESRHRRLQVFRLQQVIAVYEDDQFTSGKSDSCVARDRGPAIPFLRTHPDKVVFGVGSYPLDRAVARTIINNNDFKIPVSLTVNSVQALADPPSPVVSRHDKAGKWVVHA